MNQIFKSLRKRYDNLQDDWQTELLDTVIN